MEKISKSASALLVSIHLLVSLLHHILHGQAAVIYGMPHGHGRHQGLMPPVHLQMPVQGAAQQPEVHLVQIPLAQNQAELVTPPFADRVVAKPSTIYTFCA